LRFPEKLFSTVFAVVLLAAPMDTGTASGQTPVKPAFPSDAAAAVADPASLYYDPNPRRADDFLEPGDADTAPPPADASRPADSAREASPEPTAPALRPDVERDDAPPSVAGTSVLEAAQARRDRAFRAYTRLVTSDEQGDVDAALAEYKAAVDALERLQKEPKKPKRRRHR
jgi:hypothetical protein